MRKDVGDWHEILPLVDNRTPGKYGASKIGHHQSMDLSVIANELWVARKMPALGFCSWGQGAVRLLIHAVDLAPQIHKLSQLLDRRPLCRLGRRFGHSSGCGRHRRLL